MMGYAPASTGTTETQSAVQRRGPPSRQRGQRSTAAKSGPEPGRWRLLVASRSEPEPAETPGLHTGPGVTEQIDSITGKLLHLLQPLK